MIMSLIRSLCIKVCHHHHSPPRVTCWIAAAVREKVNKSLPQVLRLFSRRARVFNLEANTSAGVFLLPRPVRLKIRAMCKKLFFSRLMVLNRSRLNFCAIASRWSRKSRWTARKSGAKWGKPICPSFLTHFDSNFQLNSSRETSRDA